jgi:hypothetical protein
MKVDKLVANNQPENWFYTVTNECLTYPMSLVTLEENELIVDIGANVGGFVNAWKYLTNNWLLVEPSVYNCEQIENNLDGLQFTLVNKDGCTMDTTCAKNFKEARKNFKCSS